MKRPTRECFNSKVHRAFFFLDFKQGKCPSSSSLDVFHFFFRVGWNLSDEISNGRVGSVVGNGPFHSYEKEKEP